MTWMFARAIPTNVCSFNMDRQYELENLRRSIAMLRVGTPATAREAAMSLVRQLQALKQRIRHQVDGMQQMLNEAGKSPTLLLQSTA